MYKRQGIACLDLSVTDFFHDLRVAGRGVLVHEVLGRDARHGLADPRTIAIVPDTDARAGSAGAQHAGS